MRNILLVFIFALAAGTLTAQKAAIKQGRRLMEALAYNDAIEHYNQYLKDGKNNDPEAIFNLAEAYRKVNATIEAEEWYFKAVQLPEVQPEHKLYYGMMLQRNGKCEAAVPFFQQYVDLRPDDQRGQYLLRACDFEEELMTRSAGIYEITHCDFNTDLDDFSPKFYKKGMVFSSDRDRNPIIVRENAWTGNPFLELYYVDVRDRSKGDTACGEYVFGRPEKFSNTVNTKFHEASMDYDEKRKEIFFTRNNFLDGKKGEDDNGIIKLKIYGGKDLGEGVMGEFVSLPFNGDEYNVAHPALTADGERMYFASDMPGGFGGLDIYYSDREGNNWGPANNLGPEVNTEGHESFPSVGPDGRIYFASDGLVGLGGMDIYFIEEREEGIYTTPENLGFPMNTIDDDFGVTFNESGTCGFFASDRAGGVGRDDIYSFKKTGSSVEVLVYDESTELPLEGVLVVVDCQGETMSTDEDGKIRFDLKANECCDLTASLADYVENTAQGCTKNIPIGQKVLVEIPLKREAKFELDGVVYDDGKGIPLGGAKVTIEKDGVVVDSFLTQYPEGAGRFYFELEENACYKLKAVKQGYLADWVEDICTVDLTESTTFKHDLHLRPTEFSDIIDVDDPTDESEPYTTIGGDIIPKDPDDVVQNTKNETDYAYLDMSTGVWTDKADGTPADGEYPDGTEFEDGKITKGLSDLVIAPVNPVPGGKIGYLIHIYYDFNKSYIRDDAVPELEKLYTLMQENEDYIIEIGSHTDARGSKKYNISLSQRRAQAVVDWLMDRGIDEERLVPRGYGETRNVNKCANFIPCSERDHQMNRRTEFRVVGCLTCLDPSLMEDKAISKAPAKETVIVDECADCPF